MIMFINPINNGYLTSAFGPRMVDRNDGKGLVKSNHQGVDISRRPNTNVDILAAADGEVIRVANLGTYGNIVIIKHSINGKRMDTNYAHLKNSSTLVKVGQKVKQGQKIATMGGTGGNFAPHLHFEIHNGAWLTNQPNAINPELYVKLYRETELNKMKEEIKALQATVKQMAVVLKNQDELIQLQNKMVVELAKNIPLKTSPDKASVWAEEAMAWGVDVKIIQGDSTGFLNPKGLLSREEFLTVLKRYDNYRLG